MNKQLLLILVLTAVLCCAAAAFAEAEITVTDQILIAEEGNWVGYFYAKVENTGDAGAYLANGELTGTNAAGEVILSDTSTNAYPGNLYLEPGEYGYVKRQIYENRLETDTVADYTFTIGTGEWGTQYAKLPCEATFEYLGPDSFDNYVYVTFTNETDEVLYDYWIASALYDQNGSLITVLDASFSLLGINPGSTVTVKQYIDGDAANYFTNNSLVPTTVDSIVYIY